MNNVKIDQLLEGLNLQSHSPATHRIAEALAGDSYRDVRYKSKEDLGRWSDMSSSSWGISKINTDLRSITDRVRVEMRQLPRERLDYLGIEEVSAVISYAAEWYMNNHSRTEIDSRQYNNIRESYSAAAKALARFLKSGSIDDFKKMLNGEDNEDGESATIYFNSDEAQNSDGNHEDGPSSTRVFMLPMDRFSKYLSREASTFEFISKMIDTVPSLTMEIEVPPQRDPEGEDIEPIKLDVNRLMKMTASGFSALAMPEKSYFPLVVDSLQMKEWVTIRDYKRIEAILIDGSGSMSWEQRNLRALGYMYNRLEKVREGKAVVAVVGFGTQAVPFVLADGTWLIDTPEKAEQAMVDFCHQYIVFKGGGGTNIPNGVQAGLKLVKMMKEKMSDQLFDTPHLTVITDDDSSSTGVYLDKDEDIVMNVIATAENAGMRALTVKTGGKYLPMNIIKVEGE